ncbi:MAG: hypothetical protein A2508_10665 [Candidatus Lambdaproteobacteria bacterium RIFOXYD12_FULL_49_8]|uniref:Uncharacterized protein n=1 Tax=Candidatus Lambdaproteobacteria bacterium RIFOXYD2_FULL_50_16 TaxID=1817772 RepID=A0A1F6G4X9_9PROT|nr:MAG: hypothetical protein A2527_14460 [Candidatus Lambdaproteobacteria bacterium RIFOXYD2_FULL_50_16]OGG98343.1 MAG: hypothetical protein A2508_10665 [Candidatus Lambdaproteobacteria bacterium RIFOXYD12_FULL_49_8]
MPKADCQGGTVGSLLQPEKANAISPKAVSIRNSGIGRKILLEFFLFLSLKLEATPCQPDVQEAFKRWSNQKEPT